MLLITWDGGEALGALDLVLERPSTPVRRPEDSQRYKERTRPAGGQCGREDLIL